MNKVEQAQEILEKLGLPKKQQNERSALTLLSLAQLTKDDDWSDVQRPLLRTVDMMQWMADKYDKVYKPNSRETIRRQTLHQFVQALIVAHNPDDPSRPTNSGNNVYQITERVAEILRSYGTEEFDGNCEAFLDEHDSLKLLYEKKREFQMVPVTLPDGTELTLSAGDHNVLQKLIVEEFGPRFAPAGRVLYLGDTADKLLFLQSDHLAEIGVPDLNHDKLPDVVVHDVERNWLFLIEAVTSHGPVSPKRHKELEEMFSECTAGRVYVTAFLTLSDFKKYAAEIAWESEAWIAETADHMIHFDGVRFLGPYDGA